MLITTGFGLIVAAVVELWAEPIVGIFVKEKTPEVIRLGGTYIRGYIWDCVFAGIHFCFSGYFCAYGKSGISFLHNFLAIILVRIPGAYFASKFFAETLFPMGLAAPAGSLLSVVICVVAFWYLRKKKGLFS